MPIERKTRSVPFSNGTLLNIAPRDSSFYMLWFSDSNGKRLPIPRGIEVYIIKGRESLLKPFMGVYYIAWFYDYVLKRDGIPFLVAGPVRAQLIEHGPARQGSRKAASSDTGTFQ